MPRLLNQTTKYLDENVRTILEMMFAEYQQLIVKTEFTEGYSDSQIFLVRPTRFSSSELPVIVKVGSRTEVQQEWEAYQHCIQHRLPTAAGIQRPPIFEESMGGLRYQQIGEGTFDVESLGQFCSQASISDIEQVLRRRLFTSLSKIWKDKSLQPDMLMQAAYDWILPVNLIVDVSRTDTNLVPNELNAAALNEYSGDIGDFVRITGFQVTEIISAQPILLLNSTYFPYHLYVIEVPNIEQYQIGDIISTPLIGQIRQTREAFLANEAKKIVSPEIDLQSDKLLFLDKTLLPNPLKSLPAVLSLSFDVFTACIHGSLHINNVLIEPLNLNAYLIDFAKARMDHVLHDFLHLEMSVITGLLPDIMADVEISLEAIRNFFENLHKATVKAEPYVIPPGLDKPFAILQTLRLEAQEYLYRPNQWQEYYAGLFIYLISALKFDNLDEHPSAPLPKQLAFWGAATIWEFMEHIPALKKPPLSFRQSAKETASEEPRLLSEHEKLRQTLIDDVRNTWVEGLLNHSVPNSILLELNLAYVFDETNRNQTLDKDVDGKETIGISLFEMIQMQGRRLLILGEPGSGKTITLLQLAQALLDQAEQDFSLPIPIILNLSSWGNQQLPIDEWIVEELFIQQQMARPLSRQWLEKNQLTLLLDGLDEVAESYRNECLMAINSFMLDYQTELVICCRSDEYEHLKARLNVSIAVRIQPLTDYQIEQYLAQHSIGSEFLEVLKEDPGLYNLARSPLMLTGTVLAYQGMSQEERRSFEPEKWRQYVIDRYTATVPRERPLPSVEETQGKDINSLLATLNKYAPPNRLRQYLPGSQSREKARMRETIAKRLGNLRATEATESLIAQLDDPESGPRHAAAEALGKIGDERAIDPLQKALADPDGGVRETAKLALERLRTTLISRDIPKGVPFQVPSLPPMFIGRSSLIAEIEKEGLVSNQFCILYGMAGIGKTTLACQLAHTWRERFPDGVLWVELSGTALEEEGMENHLMSFLRIIARAYSIKVDNETELIGLTNVIQNLIRTKRAFIILDGAESTEVVRPFLPPFESACTFLITTRNPILFAEHGISFKVPLFTNDESMALFRQILGKRVDEEIVSVQQIIELVEFLPLALEIIANYLAEWPELTFAEYYEFLKYNLLENLVRLNDASSSLRASFEFSYMQLSWPIQRFFAQLAVFGRERFDIDAVSYVTSLPRSRVNQYLDHLTSRSLIEQVDYNRYHLHALLHEFASSKLDELSIDPELLARIEFTSSSLFETKVDALIYSTNTGLGRGMGEQLIKLLDPEIIEEISIQPDLTLGETYVGKPGPLPARHLIHTPIRSGDEPATLATIKIGLTAALTSVEKLENIKTIALASVGTGYAKLDPIDTAPVILDTIIKHLEKDSKLEQIIFALVNDEIRSVYLSTYKSMGGIIAPEQLSYRTLIRATPNQITVGQSVRLAVELIAVPPDSSTVEESSEELIRIPPDAGDIHCFITAEGLRVKGSEAVTIRQNPQTGQPIPANFELQGHLQGRQPYSVEFFVDDPQTGQRRIFQAGGQITVKAPQSGEVIEPILPPLNIRMAPQPALVLQVQADWTDGTNSLILTYYFTSRLPGARYVKEPVGQVTLSQTNLNHIWGMVYQTVNQTHQAQPEDVERRLLSLGMWLYDRLFPDESAVNFRRIYWEIVAARKTNKYVQEYSPLTLLVIEDVVKNGLNWLPWELVAPYQDEGDLSVSLWGEHFQISRWADGLGPTLFGEFPLGELALIPYKDAVLKEEEQQAQLLAWQELLQATGQDRIAGVIKPETEFYGLHILRHANETMTQRELAVRDGRQLRSDQTPEEEARGGTRLDLKLKRPVVTFSTICQTDYTLSGGTMPPKLTEQVLPFLRAGASVVVGTWWPTSEAADRIYWHTFYDLIERRVRLGEAVWRARLAVRDALPQRIDWLSYTLFGDPRAKAYWPEESQGYTSLECLNPETDGSLLVGKTYYMRVSLGSRPPIWYHDRIAHIQPLPDSAQARFIAPGLQEMPSELVNMSLNQDASSLHAIFDVTPTAPNNYLILVQLFENGRQLQTLQTTLEARMSSQSSDLI